MIVAEVNKIIASSELPKSGVQAASNFVAIGRGVSQLISSKGKVP